MSCSLSDADVDRIAERVVEFLGRGGVKSDLVDASEVARLLGVSREYVYEHADELGAIRLGAGEKARLRFDPDKLIERDRPAVQAPPARRRRRRGAPVDLLPVREAA